MFEKLKVKRAFNNKIDKIYKEYKKCKADEKVNGITFKKALENFYNNSKDSKEFDGYYNYCISSRYATIKSSYESIISLAVSWLSAFVPTMILGYFNVNLFVGLPLAKIIVAAVVVFALMMVFMIFAFSIGSTIILPWVFFTYPKDTYKKYNIEIKVIADCWKKSEIISNDYISIKSLIIKYIVTGISALMLSAISLLFFWAWCA